jgi:hypothetical protein
MCVFFNDITTVKGCELGSSRSWYMYWRRNNDLGFVEVVVVKLWLNFLKFFSNRTIFVSRTVLLTYVFWGSSE